MANRSKSHRQPGLVSAFVDKGNQTSRKLPANKPVHELRTLVTVIMKLTKRDVLYIFSQRAQVNTHESNALTSRQLAAKYGISERTIRDIWSRRSRRTITQPAWTVEEVLSENKRKRMGRPPGAKDTAPRRRNRNSGSEQETSYSDDGTGRQSDTTGSSVTQSAGNNGSTGDSNSTQQESSSGSNQDHSSSGSAQDSSSQGSGESSPRPQDNSAAPSRSEQNMKKDQLNQAVLSLLNHDFKGHFKQEPFTQQARSAPAPVHAPPMNKDMYSSPSSVAPSRTLDAYQSFANFPQLVTSSPSMSGTGEISLQFPPHVGSGAYQPPNFVSNATTNAHQPTVPLAGSLQRQDSHNGLGGLRPSHGSHGQPGEAFASSKVFGGAPDASYGAPLQQLQTTPGLGYAQQHQAPSDLALQSQRWLSTPNSSAHVQQQGQALVAATQSYGHDFGCGVGQAGWMGAPLEGAASFRSPGTLALSHYMQRPQPQPHPPPPPQFSAYPSQQPPHLPPQLLPKQHLLPQQHYAPQPQPQMGAFS